MKFSVIETEYIPFAFTGWDRRNIRARYMVYNRLQTSTVGKLARLPTWRILTTEGRVSQNRFVKVRAIPEQPWTGPEGSSRLRSRVRFPTVSLESLIGLILPAALWPWGWLRHYKKRVKCKAVSLQAWSDPEGSRKLRFPDFMTTAQDGGKVVSLTHRPTLIPQEIFLVFISDGARGGVVVKALRYKPAGRGFNSRWCHWNFSVT